MPGFRYFYCRRNLRDLSQEGSSYPLHLKSFDVPVTGQTKRMAKIRISIQAKDCFGQRLNVIGLDKKSVANNLWNGRGSGRDNRLAGGHRLQKDDAETFLSTW